MTKAAIPLELQNVGKWLEQARRQEGLTQRELATRTGISQPRVSGIEKGEVLPTLSQFIELSRALSVPLQWFLNGAVTPGREIPDYAIQLRAAGVVDLHVANAQVPGAFRPLEEILGLAVSGNQPNPRIIEALPAVLAWNPWTASRLREYSRPRESKESIRLAWLADVALTIHRTSGFPGGCPQFKTLEAFVGPLSKAQLSLEADNLGRPGEEGTLPPVSKRWKIVYGVPLGVFVERALRLHSQRERGARSLNPAGHDTDE